VNPSNVKGVDGIEVFVPSDLLRSGLCLVDTPGIGSVFLANTLATRAFLPRLDAALVTIGVDPPLSADELALISEVARQTAHWMLVLTKADRHTAAERAEVIAFTQSVVRERLGATPDVLQVSATEVLRGAGSTAGDWPDLQRKLRQLASESGAALVERASRRALAALIERVQRRIEEHRAALVRPLEESEARIAALRGAVTGATQSLQELGHRLDAAQERATRDLADRREQFLARASASAANDLSIALAGVSNRHLREEAARLSINLTQAWLERWRTEEEPAIHALYDQVEAQFRALAEEHRRTVARAVGVEQLGFSSLGGGLARRSTYHYTAMLHVAPVSWVGSLLDAATFGLLREVVHRRLVRYLTRLLETNSARVVNDFKERVLESRRALETDLRHALQELVTGAELALQAAETTRRGGAAETSARLAALDGLRRRLADIRAAAP